MLSIGEKNTKCDENQTIWQSSKHDCDLNNINYVHLPNYQIFRLTRESYSTTTKINPHQGTRVRKNHNATLQ